MEKKISLRVHTNTTGSVLAAADAQLVGKTLRENNISFHVSEKFYHDKLVDENEFMHYLSEATNINLVGEVTINAAQKNGSINQKHGKMIAGVPHAQIYRL